MTDLATHLMLLQKPVSTGFLKTNRIIYGRMTSGLLAVELPGAYSSCRPSSKKDHSSSWSSVYAQLTRAGE